MVTEEEQIQTASSSAKAVNEHPRPVRPRRVLFIIDQLCTFGGAERMLIDMATRLSHPRYQVSILTFAIDRSVQQFASCPVPIKVLPIGKTLSLAGLRAAGKLRRFLREIRPDIVHTFFETSDLWAAPIARLTGCRVLISSRRDMGVLRRALHRRAYPFVDPLFTRVLTVSNCVQKFALRSPLLSPKHITTLYNGIDITSVDAARHQSMPSTLPRIPSTRLIVALANIRRVKGLDVLIESFRLISARFPDVNLVIAGKTLEPATMGELQQTVRSHGMEGRVLFAGPLSNPFPLLERACLFVLPSRSEGFSNAVLEAMACALPVVATDVGGNAEAVVDGDTGFIVPPENHGAMAERMQQLLKDEGLSAQFGERGRRRVVEHFSMASMMRQLELIYEECCGEVR